MITSEFIIMGRELLDVVVCELGIAQRVRSETECFGKIHAESVKESSNLGHISELGRHNIVPLKVAKNYKLLELKVESENSLLASILAPFDMCFDQLDQFEQTKWLEQFTQTETHSLAQSLNINIIIWSGIDIKLISAEAGVVDRITVIIYRNKYGQYYPIINNNYRVHAIHSSPLLVKLLNCVGVDGVKTFL